MSLKESEQLGAGSPYINEESDLDMSDEESVMDPYEQFSIELEKLFLHCLETQNVSRRPHKQFISALVMETRSMKLIYNI